MTKPPSQLSLQTIQVSVFSLLHPLLMGAHGRTFLTMIGLDMQVKLDTWGVTSLRIKGKKKRQRKRASYK